MSQEVPAPPGCRTVVTQSCRKIPVEVQKKLPDEKCEEVPDIVCHLELEKYEVVLTNIYLCCRLSSLNNSQKEEFGLELTL